MARRTKQSTFEAAQWWAVNRDGAPTKAQRERFADWLRESPANVAEYLEVATLWQEMGAAPALRDADVDALLDECAAAGGAETDNVVPLRPAPASNQKPSRPPAARRRRTLLLGLPAVGALLAAAALWWAATPRDADERVVATAVGEQRSLALDDGSVVNLNTRTAIRVRLGSGERRVELLEGEALFEIARRGDQHFVVDAGVTEIRVLGTRFNVRRRSDGTATVTVLQGRVEVRRMAEADAPPAAAPAANLELREGQQARIGGAAPGILPQPANLPQVIAWTDRRLIFEDAPLADVVAEFNRYNARPLRVEDPALAALRLNGVFRPHDPDSLLQYLQRAEGVRVYERPAERLIGR